MSQSAFQLLLMRIRSAPRVWLYHLGTLPGPLAKRLRLVACPVAGALAGLAVLHPFSMLVCQLSGMLGGMSSGQALAHSFHPSMWLMWLFYAGLGGVVGYFTALFVNRIRLIEGLIRICAWCGRIHVPGEQPGDPGVWKRLDFYLLEKGVQETHGVCPGCLCGQTKERRKTRTA
jgi:hypothetical protein